MNAKGNKPNSTSFKKGSIPWNKGTKGIMKSNSGTFKKGMKVIFTDTHRKKLRDKAKKRKYTKEEKERLSELRIGTKHSDETKEKIRQSHLGEKSHLWQGGKSFEIYPRAFNSILKEKIRKRDNYTCQECSIHQNKLKQKLSIHHIDYDKKNNEENNLISLCRNCHQKTNFNQKDWTNHFKEKI